MPFETVATHRGVVVAPSGAVAASQPLAVSAGLDVLARGGTFADAAIAASAVLCVVEPWASHLGGDAFMITFDARTRETLAFNGSGAAPRTATRDAYAAAGGIPERGLRASAVPGLVSAWFALHERFGSRPVGELLAPAIGYARDGFAAGPRWVWQFGANADLLASLPALCAALGSDAAVRLGDTIRQPDLAWTLEQIAAGGAAAFYNGIVAERIAAHAARSANGHFTTADLAAHRTRVLTPLRASYRGLTVHGQPPPSQGHILLQELALASGFDLAGMDEADRTHVLVEAKKLAFADRNAYLADPETATGSAPSLESLLTEKYAARRRSLIRLDRALADPPAGDPTQAGTDTTYFLVADKTGSAVSFIQSVFHSFGCAEVADGTGVLFNNRLTGFSLDRASPNVLAPGKRPAHTLNAWLATHAQSGALAHVGGSPGGHVQVQTNLQLLVALVDGGMDPQQAAERWRWQHLAGSAVSGDPATDSGGVLEIEARAPHDLDAALRARGQDACLIGPWAHGSAAQVLSVLPGGAFAVGSDPRCDGHAAGF